MSAEKGSCFPAGTVISVFSTPPPPPPLASPSFFLGNKKLYQRVAEGKTPVTGDHEEAKVLIKNRNLRCGLVALWMAGHLLKMNRNVTVEEVVKLALDKQYTAQGEMFSADNMAQLAEDVYNCQADVISGGMMGSHCNKIISHIIAGLPVLVPYDEDFNHEPCQRGGHRAHWAAISGVLLGLVCESLSNEYKEDPDIPGLFYPASETTSYPQYIEDFIVEVYLLAKQGKSLKYQLWEYQRLHESNLQLTEFCPKRNSDGLVYIVPDGGVTSGLSGKVVLLK
ncbi:UPF0692 protein C19orf54 homolog isoform X2 [Protopterus annectens]|uniref:UPF0692 protein C19orf54 homolog isoform X2 n=1 Tax=Protopterus annectens TaxID=7888 RepID=UPI001CFAE45E|nr:UPF0692 protein C19orf54 homolog isoform X2 [Protopterus annectens]